MQKSILHITTTFIYKAGSCRRTYYILKALVENGYFVTLIVGRDFEPACDWDMSGIKIIKIPALVKYVNPLKDLKAFYILYQYIKKERPGIVHTHLAKAGILGRLASKLANVKTVIHTVHGPTFPKYINSSKRLIYKILEKLCGYVTDWFVFVGEELRNEYIKNKIAKRKNTVVIRSGRMDVEFEYAKSLNNDELLSLRKSFGIGANCFLITYVGRLVQSKSLEDAMRVLKLVRNAGVDAYLMFVGEGLLKEEIRYKFYLENLIYTMGLASYVRFTGYQTDVFRFIKASDVIIMTSKYEGLPNIAVEAGICFKPFVAYNVCGLAEVIENGKTGYIVDQGDINRMSSILVYLFNNKDSVHKIGINARTKLELDYNLNKMIIDKLNFYEKINLINIL